MYLGKLILNNFRSCEESTLEFHEDLTVLVGENNAGKSNILDAIRLVTLPINERVERYCEEEDLRHQLEKFRITAHFAGLNNLQKGLLITALATPDSNEAIFGIEYTKKDIKNPFKKTTKRWMGNYIDNGEIEPEAKQLVRHIYLPALRDAQKVLSSGSSQRIYNLLTHFSDKQKVEDFEKQLANSLGELSKHSVISKVSQTISHEENSPLRRLTEGNILQHAQLEFTESKLAYIARDLRFKLAEYNCDLMDITQSGLGYANLLYMATVLAELENAKNADLTLFLVEEPEAHLHPQLQYVLLNVLKDYAKNSHLVKEEKTPYQPQGRIQVIVTTHSPNLTSAVSIRNIAMVRLKSDIKPSDQASSNANTSQSTVGILINKLSLDDKEYNKIDRYLDVTRSALLFSRRVLLAEGLAEILLLPVFARKLIYKDKKDRSKLACFISAAFISVNGIDFMPYAKLLKTSYKGLTLADKVVIITDSDNKHDDLDESEKSRITELKELLGDEFIKIAKNYTFEAEIFLKNPELCMKIIEHKRSDTAKKLKRKYVDEGISEVTLADAVLFVKLIEKEKGDFAQKLAEKIQKGIYFKVPQYIEEAIRLIAEGKTYSNQLQATSTTPYFIESTYNTISTEESSVAAAN